MVADPVSSLVEVDLAEVVRIIRRRLRMQGQQLASELAVKPNAVSAWERGAIPGGRTLFALSEMAERAGLAAKGQGPAFILAALRVTERRRGIVGESTSRIWPFSRSTPRQDHRFQGRLIVTG